MKILFLSENFPPETNAAATRVFERALYWVGAGHQVTVITSQPNFPHGKIFDGYQNRWYQVEEMQGIRVVRVKTYIAANQGFARRIADFISYMITAFFAGLFQRRPDVVVATSPQFFAAVCGWMLGLAKRTPFVFELGDIWPKSILTVGAMRDSLAIRLLEKLELFLYRQSECVVALTHAFKDDLMARGITGDKISVVINGVDLSRYQPRERDTELATRFGLLNSFNIGYVGTHGMAHALLNVVKAAELLKHRDDIKFFLIGAGAERTMLIEEAKKRDVYGKQIIFIDAQPKELMPQIWSLCDVALVHLKDSQAFAEVIPSKIFEAMGMGLPILMAAPIGEASEIINADNAGLCVAPEDPQALADAAQQLKDQAGLRDQLAQSSFAARLKHTRQVQADTMIEALELARQRRGHETGSIGARS